MTSIIMPAYNAEQHIKRAVQSVLNQIHEDYELIIVNDGSTDDTKEICEKLMYKDARIRLINKENGGLSSARNAGVECARGEFIAFLDADDEYYESFLQKMILAMEEYNPDMVVCGYDSIFDDGTSTPSKVFDEMVVLNKSNTIIELIRGYRLSSHAWNKLFKKKVWDDIRYPDGMNYEDMYVMPDIIDRCDKTVFVPERLVRYYQNKQSITHQISLKNECNAFQAAYRRLEIYRDLYPEMYSYLVKEPLEIALRLVSKKKDDNPDESYYVSIEEILEDFLKKSRRRIDSYKNIRQKYKLLLVCYPIFRGKIRNGK